MIPAILSCLFVLYLYRTLNSPEESGPDASGSDRGRSSTANVEQRIRELQQRVEQLTAALEGRKSP